MGTLEELVKQTASAFEVVLKGASDRASSELEQWGRVVSQGDAMFVTLEEEARLQEFLKWALQCGLAIERVTPRKATIEELFVREATEAGETGEGADG